MKPNKTFIIRHKETKQVWTAPSGKSSWKATNHAKAAWSQGVHYWNLPKGINTIIVDGYRKIPKFNEQDVYEVVELKHQSEDRLREAIGFLKQLSDNPGQLMAEVRSFIKEVESELQ